MKITKTMETVTEINLKDIESILGISDITKAEVFFDIDIKVDLIGTTRTSTPMLRIVSRKDIECPT